MIKSIRYTPEVRTKWVELQQNGEYSYIWLQKLLRWLIGKFSWWNEDKNQTNCGPGYWRNPETGLELHPSTLLCTCKTAGFWKFHNYTVAQPLWSSEVYFSKSLGKTLRFDFCLVNTRPQGAQKITSAFRIFYTVPAFLFSTIASQNWAENTDKPQLCYIRLQRIDLVILNFPGGNDTSRFTPLPVTYSLGFVTHPRVLPHPPQFHKLSKLHEHEWLLLELPPPLLAEAKFQNPQSHSTLSSLTPKGVILIARYLVSLCSLVASGEDIPIWG